MAIGACVSHAIMIPLALAFLLIPFFDGDKAESELGAAAQPLFWLCCVGGCMQTFYFVPVMAPFAALLPVESAKFTTKLIETYLGKVKSTMLASLDVVEEPTRAMFVQLSKDQATVEKWAHSLNARRER